MKGKKKKAWTRMSATDLERATAEFDKEFVADTFNPLTARDKARWAGAKRGPGRPRQGKGAQVISVSIERDLLKECDRLARRRKFTRAQLIARGLRAVLSAEKS